MKETFLKKNKANKLNPLHRIEYTLTTQNKVITIFLFLNYVLQNECASNNTPLLKFMYSITRYSNGVTLIVINQFELENGGERRTIICICARVCVCVRNKITSLLPFGKSFEFYLLTFEL